VINKSILPRFSTKEI